MPRPAGFFFAVLLGLLFLLPRPSLAVEQTAIDPDIDEGHRLFAHEKYEEALEHYLKALERNENDAELNYRIGMAHFCLMNLNSTVAYIEKAISIDNTLDDKYSYYISSNSSSPTFLPGDVVMFDYIHYKYEQVSRNDVIRLEIQEGNAVLKQILKQFGITKKAKLVLTCRVVGLPGDVLEVKGKDVVINGRKAYSTKLSMKEYYFKEGEAILIPQDNFFVKVLNESSRLDSLLFGFITSSDIVGKILLVYVSSYDENGEERVRKERIGLKIN